MPFKRDLVLPNIPLSKYEDITWSPRYNLPATRTNKRRALSLQEVELDGWFLILHIVLETYTIEFMHKFKMNYVYSWIDVLDLNHPFICICWSWVAPKAVTVFYLHKDYQHWHNILRYVALLWRFWLESGNTSHWIDLGINVSAKSNHKYCQVFKL